MLDKSTQEIERRFLVRGLGPNMPAPERVVKIDQGYIERTGHIDKSLRIRISDDTKAELGMKSGKGILRGQLESELINIESARLMLKECDHRILKRRLAIEGWEIDIFESPLLGVIIAEKEMDSVDEELLLPPWLKGVIEVTDTLTNHHLARLASDLEGADVLAMPYLTSHIFNTIPRIVLTGGPCSGKSTVIEAVRKELPETHCVPEMATIVISQFGILPGANLISNRSFQRTIYRAQRIFEATSTQFAMSERKKAILFDRGVVDGAAYMPGGIREFERFFGTDIKSEYNQYDKVICLDTPPRDIYEKGQANNPARFEDYDMAKKLGDKVRDAWSEHPNFVFIPNGDSWESKQIHAIEAIRQS